jgi:hypothetical protein
MKSLSLILIALLLTSCASAPDIQYTGHSRYIAAIGKPAEEWPPLPVPSVPLAPASASGVDVMKEFMLLPLLLPFAVLENYPSYRASRTTCRSYVYKDQYHTTCY